MCARTPSPGIVGAANSAAGAFLFGAGAVDQAVTAADADASIDEHTCFLLLDPGIFVSHMFLVLGRLYHPR